MSRMVANRLARLLRRWLTAEERAPASTTGEAKVGDGAGPYRRAGEREETTALEDAAWAPPAKVVPDTSLLPGETKRVGRGTRPFAPGSKVFVRRIVRGEGGDVAEVVGRHRGSKRYVRMVVRPECLEDARVRVVYPARIAPAGQPKA
jgi:hypothetical protein